jgi:hypothetical protein
MTDHGHQFESQLFHCLAKLCDIKLCMTSLHFANGHVEHLHHKLKAAIMRHEPALSDPGSIPFMPRHIHPQGPRRLNTRPTMAGHCTPCFGPTMQGPKVTACTEITFKIMGAASRSQCQQTASILHTFWKQPNMAPPPPPPAIHQLSPTELQLQMPHQLLGLFRPQALVAVSAFWCTSTPVFSFPGYRDGDLGTTHQLRMALSTLLSSDFRPAVHW